MAETRIYNPKVFNIIGNPIISADGLASGFSSSNYIQSLNDITFNTGDNWDIIIRLKEIAHGSFTYFQIYTAYDKNSLQSDSGSSDSVYWTCPTTPAIGATNRFLQYNSEFKIGENLNRFVYLKYSHKNGQYILSHSFDGEEYIDEIALTSDQEFTGTGKLRLGFRDNGNGFNGTIDLSSIIVKINGSEVFAGGQKKISLVDKLLYLNDTKQIIKSAIEAKGVQVPTETPFRQYADKIGEISGDGLEPDFDYTKFTEHNTPKFIRTLGLVAGNDYSESPLYPRFVSYGKNGITVDLSTANSWEVRAGFFMPPSVDRVFNVITAAGNPILSTEIDPSNKARLAIGDGSSWFFTNLYGDIPLELNKKYIMSIKYEDSNYTLSFNDRIYGSVASSGKIGTFDFIYFGVNRNGEALPCQDVVQDLRDFAIYADGVQVAPV